MIITHKYGQYNILTILSFGQARRRFKILVPKLHTNLNNWPTPARATGTYSEKTSKGKAKLLQKLAKLLSGGGKLRLRVV